MPSMVHAQDTEGGTEFLRDGVPDLARQRPAVQEHGRGTGVSGAALGDRQFDTVCSTYTVKARRPPGTGSQDSPVRGASCAIEMTASQSSACNYRGAGQHDGAADAGPGTRSVHCISARFYRQSAYHLYT